MTQTIKRGFDVVISFVALLVLSPLLVAIGIAVSLSPGSIFFRQSRLGRNGVPFDICKFRTMVHNAPDIRNADGSAFSGSQDPRVTSIGRWLRCTSLDELPQLWNVLKGDMSLVGPRPDQVDQLRFYSQQERIKLQVRPGITGLAQISGRNRINWQERKRLDREYVENWSFAVDLVILFRTLPYFLRRSDVNEHA